MKKMISSLLLSAMMLASTQPLPVNAVDPVILTTRMEPLAAPVFLDYGDDKIEVPEGTLEISVTVTDNKGFSVGDIAVPYDSDILEPLFEPSKDKEKDKEEVPVPLFKWGCEWAGDKRIKLLPEVTYYDKNRPENNNNKKGCLCVSFMGSWVLKDDGYVCSFYVKAKEGKNIDDYSPKDLVTQPRTKNLKTKDNVDVPHTESPKIEYVSETPPKKGEYNVVEANYLIGDVNGDWKTTLEDAQAICKLLDDDGTPIDADSRDVCFKTSDKNFKGLHFKLGTAEKLDLHVADVDGDKDVDMYDAQLILHNYTRTISYSSTSAHNNCKKCKDGKNLVEEKTGVASLYIPK